MSVTVPDLGTANAYVQGSVDKYAACFNSYAVLSTAYTTVSGTVGGAYGTALGVTTSWPSQAPDLYMPSPQVSRHATQRRSST